MDNEMFFQQIFQLEPIKVNPKKTLLNVRKFSFIFPFRLTFCDTASTQIDWNVRWNGVLTDVRQRSIFLCNVHRNLHIRMGVRRYVFDNVLSGSISLKMYGHILHIYVGPFDLFGFARLFSFYLPKKFVFLRQLKVKEIRDFFSNGCVASVICLETYEYNFITIFKS